MRVIPQGVVQNYATEKHLTEIAREEKNKPRNRFANLENDSVQIARIWRIHRALIAGPAQPSTEAVKQQFVLDSLFSRCLHLLAVIHL
jgi:hypothetical protein